MLLRNRPARFSIKKVQSIYEKFSKPMGWSDWQRSSSPSVEEISKPPAGRSEYDDDAIRRDGRVWFAVVEKYIHVELSNNSALHVDDKTKNRDNIVSCSTL